MQNDPNIDLDALVASTQAGLEEAIAIKKHVYGILKVGLQEARSNFDKKMGKLQLIIDGGKWLEVQIFLSGLEISARSVKFWEALCNNPIWHNYEYYND
jgi:hypothetical protein